MRNWLAVAILFVVSATTFLQIGPRAPLLPLLRRQGSERGSAPGDNDSGIRVNGKGYATIQAAIDATPLSGGEITVAPGTYTMTAALHFDNKPISLVCASAATTILNWTAINNGVYAIYLTPGSSIRDCTIEGFGFTPRKGMQWTALTSGTAPVNNGWPNWLASRAYSPGVGIGRGGTLVPTVANSNGHVYAETAPSCKTASREPSWPTAPAATVRDNSCVWQEAGPAGVQISGNHIYNWYYAIYPGFGGNMWRIDNNVIDGNDEGVLFLGDGRHVVSNNRIANNSENGIDVNTGYSTISDNEIDGNGRIHASGTDCYDEHGISIGALTTTGAGVVDSMVVNGNRIHGNANNGILIFADRSTANRSHIVSKNEVFENGTDASCTNTADGSGIAIWAPRGSVDVRGLNISGNSVSRNRKWGIQVAIGAGNGKEGSNSITGNTGSGNGSGLMTVDNPAFLKSP